MMNGTKVKLSAVPNVVWVCLTVAFCIVIGSLTWLSITGTDPATIRQFLNTVGIYAGAIISGGGAIYAGAAAKNAQDTKEQTNGALDKRIADSVAKALADKEGGTGNGGSSV